MIGSTVFYEKKKKPFAAKLSLISLMDIFTILVFFLLLNSGESQKIENAKFVDLPDSSSGIAPHTELQIVIDDEEILMGEKVVARVPDVLNSSDRIIESLAAELAANTALLGDLSSYQKHTGLAITISGDRSVSYALLKRVMTTCQHSNYRNISLAVNRVSASGVQSLGLDLESESEAKAGAESNEAITPLIVDPTGGGN